jgi:hypothetical protein
MPKLSEKQKDSAFQETLKRVSENMSLPKGAYFAKWSDMPSDWQVAAPENGMRVLAVDPGEERVGVAIGLQWAGTAELKYTTIMTPRRFRGWFRASIGGWDLVTCEKWALRADMAKTLIGSEMETVQLIGWLKGTIEDWNDGYTKDPRLPSYGYPEIQWDSNPPTIHRGTYSVLQARHLGPVSPGKPKGMESSTHTNDALSAELHWWYTLMKFGLVDGMGLKIANMPKA